VKLIDAARHIDRGGQRPAGGVAHVQTKLSSWVLGRAANGGDEETGQQADGKRI
jgi:hypothetical protein